MLPLRIHDSSIKNRRHPSVAPSGAKGGCQRRFRHRPVGEPLRKPPLGGLTIAEQTREGVSPSRPSEVLNRRGFGQFHTAPMKGCPERSKGIVPMWLRHLRMPSEGRDVKGKETFAPELEGGDRWVSNNELRSKAVGAIIRGQH
ncbi:hypothetical protein RRG08_066271 [Elysia crispata]|uniref:Uncharacterized protein n=1 Tax=Elysia crispata TaxID=231223 RepID=A0AAE1ASD4_9GAST|nr:hypothetical protein RRG08_066271 [Elysia crispata]